MAGKDDESSKPSHIPPFKHSIDEEEIAEVTNTLKSDWITRGPKTAEFENQVRFYIGCKHAIALSSCTAALHLSLAAYDIGEGDEVITTPFTFASTVGVILQQRAKPVLADIEGETYNIDPARIEEKVTDRTKAIVPVHYAGHPCEMDRIIGFAKKHGLLVLEDAAHAFGAEYNNKRVGTIGDATCFSFYATKNLTTGEGGMLTTEDDEVAEKVRILSLHGISRDAWKRYSISGSWKYEVLLPGYKYNFTDVQASIGLHQMNKFDRMQNRRREIAAMYDEGLSQIKEVVIPKVKKNVIHAWHLYPILIETAALRGERDRFVEELGKEGVGTSVHFIPIHLHPYYQKAFGTSNGDLPVSEHVFEREVSLPIYPRMTDDDVRRVIRTVDIAVKRLRV